MSAGSDFWTRQARPIRSEGIREAWNLASSVAQVWTALRMQAASPPFGVDRNWRVVFARWENNTWQWPGGISPWVYDADPASSGPQGEPDAAARATQTATRAENTADAAEKRQRETERRPPPTSEPKFVNAAHRLGVAVTATADEVRAGMRKTMAMEGAHPDQGGDPAIAQEITAAKNLLIARIKKVCS